MSQLTKIILVPTLLLIAACHGQPKRPAPGLTATGTPLPLGMTYPAGTPLANQPLINGSRPYPAPGAATVGTPYPTALAFTMDNGGCQVPCILGVNLGKTRIKEYRKALEDQFGLSFITFDYKGAVFDDAATLSYPGPKGLESAADLSLFYSDELIKGLSIGGRLSVLPYLSIKKLLANRGIPNRAFVDYQIIAPGYGLPDEAEFSLVLYYQSPWMLVRYNTLAKKEDAVYTFCAPDLSENSHKDTRVLMISQSFDKAYSDNELGEIFIGPTGHLPEGVDIQDALAMSAADFYHRIRQEDAPCFKTKIQFWENFINGGVK